MNLVNTSADQNICPFMSGRPITIKVAGVVDHPGAQGVSTMMIPCAKEKCALWAADSCSLGQGPLTMALGNVALGLTDVSDGLKVFDAPSTGSPTTHLVEAIERLIDILGDRKAVPKTPK